MASSMRSILMVCSVIDVFRLLRPQRRGPGHAGPSKGTNRPISSLHSARSVTVRISPARTAVYSLRLMVPEPSWARRTCSSRVRSISSAAAASTSAGIRSYSRRVSRPRLRGSVQPPPGLRVPTPAYFIILGKGNSTLSIKIDAPFHPFQYDRSCSAPVYCLTPAVGDRRLQRAPGPGLHPALGTDQPPAHVMLAVKGPLQEHIPPDEHISRRHRLPHLPASLSVQHLDPGDDAGEAPPRCPRARSRPAVRGALPAPGPALPPGPRGD